MAALIVNPYIAVKHSKRQLKIGAGKSLQPDWRDCLITFLFLVKHRTNQEMCVPEWKGVKIGVVGFTKENPQSHGVVRPQMTNNHCLRLINFIRISLAHEFVTIPCPLAVFGASIEHMHLLDNSKIIQ